MSPRLVFGCLLLAGCADRSLGLDDEVIAHPPNNQVTHGCTGQAPRCVDFCGSDFLQARATCESDDRVCPNHLMRMDQCPSHTCWTLPLRGETCEPGGRGCGPKPSTYDACPRLACAEGTGFGAPVTIGSWTCSCNESNQVTCERALPPI